MSNPYDWRINDIERKADRADSRLHELDSLRSDVAGLERAYGSLRAECDGLRTELQACAERLQRIEEIVAALTEQHYE